MSNNRSTPVPGDSAGDRSPETNAEPIRGGSRFDGVVQAAREVGITHTDAERRILALITQAVDLAEANNIPFAAQVKIADGPKPVFSMGVGSMLTLVEMYDAATRRVVGWLAGSPERPGERFERDAGGSHAKH